MTDRRIGKHAGEVAPHAPSSTDKTKTGKHVALPQKAATASLLMPSLLTGVAIAFVVSHYQPLAFDPSAYASAEQAIAAEIKPVEVTAERQDAQPATGANYSAADYGIDASNLKDGVYTGSGQGFRSVITVAVTVSGGKIAAIEIVSAGDDEPYFSNAKGLIGSVIAAQSTSVDTISGVTYSSKGILVAIKNALEQSAGQAKSSSAASPASTPATSNKGHVTLSPTETPASGYIDGTYYGEGEGYKSAIRVAVTVANGRISQIDIVSQGDDAAYFSRAQSLVSSIVSKQTTAVDTVSGATFSSEGILAAVEDALRQATPSTDSTGGASTDKPSGGERSDDPSSKPGGGDGSNGDGVDRPSQDKPAAGGYLDGDYTVYAKCENSKDPDAFEPYYLAMTVTVKDGKAIAIKDLHGTNKATDQEAVLGSYDEENDSYIEWAASGRTVRGKEYIGVVKQLIDLRRDPVNVDVVSRSTYSSKAIVKAYEKALELAKDAYEKANPSDKPASGDASADGDRSGCAEGSGADSGAEGSDDSNAESGSDRV